MTQLVRKVTQTKRKDPLNDLATLASIGRQASRSAREKALRQGVSFTFAKDGVMQRRNPDGTTHVIGELSDSRDFPTLEQDLCRD
jgi:hypothetical protein